MGDDEKKYWIAFSTFPGVGPVRFQLLREHFGSAKRAWYASKEALLDINFGGKLTDDLHEYRRTFDLDGYVDELRDRHIGVVTLDDPRYPSLLSQIQDPPFVLYTLGKKQKKPWDIEKSIAVVGTRNNTNYGRAATHRIVTGLVNYGCTIISGLAYGIDAIAHQATLDAGGRTIAVLGCGIDIIAPPRNSQLYQTIADRGGAIVSEMPLGMRPDKRLFPARNRIISGMALGTIVVEGATDSGSLITASYAAKQGRDVFAVPGPITSAYSKAPAVLLKQGATLVETADDVMDALDLNARSSSTVQGYTPQSEEEQKIVTMLSQAPAHTDAIARETGLTASQVSATLTILEMHGVVLHMGEHVYGMVE